MNPQTISDEQNQVLQALNQVLGIYIHWCIILCDCCEDLLKYLSDLASSIEALLQELDNDNVASLEAVFGGDCSRTGRTRAILEGSTARK